MFTRRCNYECGFCFHTEKTSHVESFENMQRGLWMLRRAGMKKINFAGGEPLLYPQLLSKLIAFCKEELGLESVSIVTNGSKLTERFMADAARYIEIIAVSCDSFDEQVNIRIGRGKGAHLAQVQEVAWLCQKYGVKFKINTVVNRYNVHEGMNEHIQALQPMRWRCFQVLIVKDENDSDQTIRDARRFQITDDEFQQFCDRHWHNECFVPESNRVMRSSFSFSMSICDSSTRESALRRNRSSMSVFSGRWSTCTGIRTASTSVVAFTTGAERRMDVRLSRSWNSKKKKFINCEPTGETAY